METEMNLLMIEQMSTDSLSAWNMIYMKVN